MTQENLTRGSGPEDGARKINLLIVASSLWIGGAEVIMAHLARTIDRQRFRLTVCCLKQPGHLADKLKREGIDLITLWDPNARAVDYFSFRKLLRVIRELRIDVVHTHTPHGLVDAALCKLLRPKLRWVHTFHFGNYPHVPTRIHWMERVFGRVADQLIAVGETQRASVMALYGFSARAIRTLPNGVNAASAVDDGSFRTQIRTGGRVLIGTLATLIEQKGLFDLLAAAARLRDSGYDVQFVIVGGGHLGERLLARRAELHLEDVVEMPGWITDAADVALPAFDVFFQPSLWEAMSVVILEAMAAGKPIVATRVGDNPRILEDGVTALLVEPGDIDAMVTALTRLVVDAGLRRRLGEAAKGVVRERFSIEQMTRSYEHIYADHLR